MQTALNRIALKKPYLLVFLCVITTHSNLFAQTFTPQEPAFATNSSSHYHWVDLDGDGDTDVFEYGDYNGVIIYTRTGSSFTAAQSGLPDNFIREDNNFRLNDYDHDNDLDIIFARFNDVAIAINTGNTFTVTDTNIKFNDDEYGSLYWQDVDGDLDLDVVHTGKIYVNNNGSYKESVYRLLPEVRKMVWGDVNNDGLVDILATNGYDQSYGNPLQVLINKGDGNFQPSDIDFGIAVRDNGALILFDANNDGKLDIAAMNETTGQCVVLVNTMTNGQLRFAAPYSLGNIAGIHVTAGDLTSDGLTDLVISGYSFADNEYQVMVFKNTTTSSLSFSKTNSFPATDVVIALHLADYDGDNDLDIHTKVFNQNLFAVTSTIMINTGIAAPAPAIPGTLTTAVGANVKLAWTGPTNVAYNIQLKRNGQFIRINPTTASGKLLLADNAPLISSSAFTIYNAPAGNYEWRVQAVNKSRRTSAFSAAGTFAIGTAPSALALQILGMTSVKLCWTFTGTANSFAIFRRTNNSPLEEIGTVPGGTLCYTDAALEKNAHYEYIVKAVTGGAYSAPSEPVVHYSSPFIPISFGTHQPNIVSASCHPADYDLDGDYDLEFMGRILDLGDETDLNFKNDGAGNFPVQVSILPTLPYEFNFNKVVDARDMDNDGDTDFCVILGSDYGAQKLALLMNENGALSLGFQTAPYLAMYQAAVADFNNDGRPDILYRHAVGNGGGNPNVYELMLQAGDGTFADSKFKFTDDDYGDLGQFKVADLNNDGFQDICFTGTQYEPLRFFINEGGMTFVKQLPGITETPYIFFLISTVMASWITLPRPMMVTGGTRDPRIFNIASNK